MIFFRTKSKIEFLQLKVRKMLEQLERAESDIEYNRERHAKTISALMERMKDNEKKMNLFAKDTDTTFVQVHEHWELKHIDDK